MQHELRRLLLAEYAMQAVEQWARSRATEKPATDPLAQDLLVDAAGLVTMFSRPFMKDNEGGRLDRAEWRAKV